MYIVHIRYKKKHCHEIEIQTPCYFMIMYNSKTNFLTSILDLNYSARKFMCYLTKVNLFLISEILFGIHNIVYQYCCSQKM